MIFFFSLNHLRVAYYRDRVFNQYRSTAARVHIYHDRQSSMGNEESSEKLIQQRGKGEGGRTEWSTVQGARGGGDRIGVRPSRDQPDRGERKRLIHYGD